jgi:uncharacterized membrane protein
MELGRLVHNLGMPVPDTEDRRASVERTVMLTDAVAAIAMTLLVLPLVEAVPEVNVDDVWSFVGDNLSLFLSFAVSFAVILLFWAAHRRVFSAVTTLTPGLKLLNATWLLVIAFLPFPTALMARGPTTSSTSIYIGSILAVSVVTTTLFVLGARVATDNDQATSLRRHAVVSAIGAVILLGATLLATVHADAALITLIALAPLRVVGGGWADRQ